MYYDDYYWDRRRDWDRRRYYDDWYYYRDRDRWYNRYDLYQSQYSNVDQSIYNSGYMSDVYQNSWVNQIMAPRRRRR